MNTQTHKTGQSDEDCAPVYAISDRDMLIYASFLKWAIKRSKSLWLTSKDVSGPIAPKGE